MGYESYADDLDGAVYGGFAGWDVLIDERWVVGAEARYAAPDTANEVTQTTASFVTTGNTEIDDQWGGSVRFGRLVTPSLLAFVQAGYEHFDVDAMTTRRPTPACSVPDVCAVTVQDFSFDEDMWTLGAGLEWALTETIRARGSYVYGESDAFERHRVALGVSYSF